MDGDDHVLVVNCAKRDMRDEVFGMPGAILHTGKKTTFIVALCQ